MRLRTKPRTCRTFTEWIYVATRDDFPEETAYQIAKVLGDQARRAGGRVQGRQFIHGGEHREISGFKLHPGTERYLREKGLIK